MANELRCSQGHRWEGELSSSCPVCGESGASVLPHVLAGVGSYVASGDQPTGAFIAPDDSSPSFSSLVGFPEVVGKTVVLSPALVASSSDGPPKVDLSGYEIVGEIGRGGMGVVYKARQLTLNRPVALKMILAGAHAGANERERFRREAEAAAALQHPHIVQIFEIGEASGHLYLALELVEGGSLAQHLSGRPWPAADAAGLVEILARTIHYAHERGIVHRDLKPGNILLAGDLKGKSANAVASSRALQPKITDFGLAKRLAEEGDAAGTRTGAVLGTPSYIAPEQASGKGRQVGPAADVYALGAILYELLTGRPPFRGETPLDTVLQVLRDDPVAPRQLQPKVPRDLETICLKCLNKSPTRRYPTALALAEDLRRFLNGEPIQARPLGPGGRLWKWAKRHPALATLGVITNVALIAMLTILSVAYAQVQKAVKEREAEAAAARAARDDARRLAMENDQAREKAQQQAELLAMEAERTRRAAYALQLAQVAAMVDRDPHRASQILDDESRCPASLRDFTWRYLRRLCQREERVYKGHKDLPVTCVAVSPVNTLVATGSTDGRIHLWDSRNGFALAILEGHVQRVTALAFRPDGRALAAVAADGSLRLWNIPLPGYPFIFLRGDAWLGTLARRAIDPVVRYSNVTLKGIHPDGANGLAFTPDGRHLATAGVDGWVRIFELGGWRVDGPDAALAGGATSWGWTQAHGRSNPTAQSIWELRAIECETPLTSLAISPEGRFLAAGGSDGRIWVWDSLGSRLIRELPAQVSAPVLALAFTPDGRRLAATNNGDTPQILLYDTEDWNRLPRRLTGHLRAIHALAISPEGQMLASGSYDSTIRLWDLETARERSVLQGHTRNVRTLAFSPAQRVLISGSQDGTARVWQVTVRPADSLEIESEGERLVAADVSSNGETLIVAGEDRRIRIWALNTDTRGRPLPEEWQVRGILPGVQLIQSILPHPLTSVATSPDGRIALAGSAEGVYVWRLPQLRWPNRLNALNQSLTIFIKDPHLIRTSRPVYGLKTNADGTVLAVLAEDGLHLWDLRLMRPITEKPLAGSMGVRDAAFGPGGRRLAMAVGRGFAISNVQDGTIIDQVPQAHEANAIESIAFSSDGQTLATADSHGRIKLWRHTDRIITEMASFQAHTEAIHTLAFSPDGLTLASGSWDRGVALWDPVTGQERASLPEHADQLLRVQFLVEGTGLVTASRDGLVKRWRAERRN